MLRSIITPFVAGDSRELVAYHDAGHAIVGAFFPRYDTIVRVSIQPKRELTLFREEGKSDPDILMNSVKMTMGGFVAEELAFNGMISTGAVDDLEYAYTLCEQMGNPSQLVGACYEETREILMAHRKELDMLKQKLINEETVDGKWIYRILFTLT